MTTRWYLVDIYSGKALDVHYPDRKQADADARIRNRDYDMARYAVQSTDGDDPEIPTEGGAS